MMTSYGQTAKSLKKYFPETLLIPPDFVGKLKDEPKSPKNSLF